jgi:hypothetical protein
VKNGFLNIDAIKMETAVGTFQGIADPKTLAEYRLVLLEKPTPDGRELDAEAMGKNLAYCKSIHDGQRMCFAGWLSDDKLSRRGILIFRKLDEDKLKSLVEELPAVKSQIWKATTMPLFMSAGIIQ